MPYAELSTAPLVWYPPVGYITDWNFAKGAFTSPDWQAAGTTTPTIVADASSGLSANIARFSFTSAGTPYSHYLQRFVDPAWILETPAAGTGFTDPAFLYARVRVNAMPAGADGWFFRVIGYKSDYSAYYSPVWYLIVGPSYADGRWRWIRLPATGNFTAGTIAWASMVMGFFGQATPAGSYSVDCGGVYFGHAFDPAVYGPAGSGPVFVGPYEYGRRRPAVTRRSTRGGYARRALVDEFQAGKLVSTPADDAAIAAWRDVRGRLTADQAATVLVRRDDISRDYFASAKVISVDDGVEAVGNQRHRKFSLQFRT